MSERIRKRLTVDAPPAGPAAALPTPEPTPSAKSAPPPPETSPPQAIPPAVLQALGQFRVAFAREVMMASIHAEINKKNFVGMDCEAHAEFAVKSADELIKALTNEPGKEATDGPRDARDA